MTRDSLTRRDSAGVARGKSVMFSVHFEDGRVGYFVIKGHGGPDQDFLATGIAQERQRAGELPEGMIRSVRRVR